MRAERASDGGDPVLCIWKYKKSKKGKSKKCAWISSLRYMQAGLSLSPPPVRGRHATAHTIQAALAREARCCGGAPRGGEKYTRMEIEREAFCVQLLYMCEWVCVWCSVQNLIGRLLSCAHCHLWLLPGEIFECELYAFALREHMRR